MKSGVGLENLVSKPAPLSAEVRAPKRIATPAAIAATAQTITRSSRSGLGAEFGDDVTLSG